MKKRTNSNSKNQNNQISSVIFKALCITSFVFLFACSNDTIIDSHVDIEDGEWHIDSLVSFQFEIEDDSLSYAIDYNVRYAVQYPYYNLYIKYYLEDSSGKVIDSEMQELMLFDKKTGKPKGEGMGDLFDRNIPIFPNKKFSYSGNYTFKVKQFMRMEKLPGILSFGVKVKKPK